MQQKHFITALALAATLACVAPATALAYLSPDQVFNGQTQDLQQAPPTQREADDIVAARNQQTAQQHREATSALASSAGAEPVDTYVPPEQPTLNRLDPNVQYDLRMQRKSNQASPSIVVAGNGTVIDSKGNVLHSGAPLVSSTGPETTLAIAALVLAGICTAGYVLWSVRRQRETYA